MIVIATPLRGNLFLGFTDISPLKEGSQRSNFFFWGGGGGVVVAKKTRWHRKLTIS